jgi:hypothetical protein
MRGVGLPVSASMGPAKCFFWLVGRNIFGRVKDRELLSDDLLFEISLDALRTGVQLTTCPSGSKRKIA